MSEITRPGCQVGIDGGYCRTHDQYKTDCDEFWTQELADPNSAPSLRAKEKELKEKIQDAIDNIRRFQRDSGTSRSTSLDYDAGRADAYIIVLGWMDE